MGESLPCPLELKSEEAALGAPRLRYLPVLGVLIPQLVVLAAVIFRHVVVELMVQLAFVEREFGGVHNEHLYFF